MSLRIESSTLGPFGTNTYLVTDEATKHCIIVDAPPESAELLLPQIRENALVVEALLLTHGHWDHIADAGAFASGNIPVFAHQDDAACYSTPEKFAPFYMSVLPYLSQNDFQPVKIARWIKDGEKIALLGREFEARHVPGHAPGSLLFYCATEKLAFSGDAIFQNSIGRTDLPGGSWDTLVHSIRTKIYTLPDDTILLPGHGGTTRVAEEKDHNPYVRPE
ncbi:MAG: MBL fold metallo-hydrolase [Puniceicoccales bacterium]|jgi:glyoxylase-like metal-dependent hydrolase (beta-lactamase superfamily II)|nr:MBL fold metallo-hydrolase [Puniceicoccales bacterium]